MVAPLSLLSPVSAALLGWILLNQTVTAWQFTGMVLVLFSAWLGQLLQWRLRPATPAVSRPRPQPPPASICKSVNRSIS